MNVYQTDNNGYFVSAATADRDPRNVGNWLIPGGCVTTAPPALNANQAAKWNGSTWVVVPDFRGRVYWLADRSRHEITERGIPLPLGALDAEPPKPLNEVRDAKLAELAGSRKQAIDTLPPVQVAGKLYPATPEYREVVTGIARRQAAGRPIPATLRGVDGTPTTLNAALINQIDDAITGAVQAAWDNYWARFEAVQAATTVEQIDPIGW